MTYVIAGVSGNTGSVVAQTLLEQGKPVRVLVRDAAKGYAWKQKGAEVAVADLADSAAVARALAGAKGAYLLLPPNHSVPEFLAHQRRVAEALTTAVREAQVPHVVWLSSVGAQLSEGNGPIRGIHSLEQMAKGLPKTHSTFLRASYFMANIGGSLGLLDQGLYPSFTPRAQAFEMVATEDIGKAAASLLIEGTNVTRVVDISGPSYSPDSVAGLLSSILGKPIQVAEAPLSQVVPTFTGFGMSQEMASLYQEMLSALAARKLTFEPGHRKLKGPTELEVVLRAMLGR